MKAMVLTAGVGSRLRPLTDAVPKALVEVGGAPMLERVLRALKRSGVREVVVNLHHHPDRIEEFLKVKRGFGLRVELSREPALLDTGGGLKKVAAFFDDGRPFFLHNVDVYAELDLGELYRFHLKRKPLATLAVRERPSSRRLVFGPDGLLRAREGDAGGEPLAFDGIHVLSPEIFPKLTETGTFSITDAYARLAKAGERVLAFRADEWFWQDIGSTEKLASARQRAEARQGC